MKHKQIKIILGLAFFLIISNIPPFQSVLKFIFDDNLYYYSTKDGSAFFIENEYKGRKFQFKRVTSAEKRAEYPEADTIIYRNFQPNLFAFWRYRDYIFDERYTLPYFPLEEARKKRQEWKEKMKAEGRPY
jgi:hypothetical protein